MEKVENQIKQLEALWYSERVRFEELIKRSFSFDEILDVMKLPKAERIKIPGTNWSFKTHGIGIDIFKTADVGGIDFDLDKPAPDSWRLKVFFHKQYNAGNLDYDLYFDLFEDEDLLDQKLSEHFKQ